MKYYFATFNLERIDFSVEDKLSHTIEGAVSNLAQDVTGFEQDLGNNENLIHIAELDIDDERSRIRYIKLSERTGHMKLMLDEVDTFYDLTKEDIKETYLINLTDHHIRKNKESDDYTFYYLTNVRYTGTETGNYIKTEFKLTSSEQAKELAQKLNGLSQIKAEDFYLFVEVYINENNNIPQKICNLIKKNYISNRE